MTFEDKAKVVIAQLRADRDRLQGALDKIRSEIMRLDYDLDSVEYDYDDMAQTEMIHTICREEVLQIIDKYMAEGSDKE